MFSCFQSCKNLLFRAAISFVGSGGTWAMVGDIVAGSLLLRSTACVTPGVSTDLLRSTRVIRTGMYS